MPTARLTHIVAFCSVTLLSTSALAQDWPQFRGPGGLGVSEAENLPITWSETENVAWKTALPGYGSSSPIALKGKLYVTCYSGYGIESNQGTMEDLTLHVLSVDGKTGKILWDQRIEPTLPESKSVRDHGYAAATPTTDGTHLYVFFGKSGVFKFDLDGHQIWRTSVGSKTHDWGSGTSPVLYENLVIVNASVESGSLVALDKETGREVWRAGGMRQSWNTPHLVTTADGRQELAVTVRGWILSFDPRTGRALWRCEGIPDYICPSIVSHQGVLYALGGRNSKTVAVRSGGRGNVTQTHKLWQADVGANVCSPIVHEGHLYWVSDRTQAAYCLSLEDGAVKYSQRVRMQPYASALLADGRLYVQTRNDGTLVLAAQPEFKQLAHNKLGDRSTFNASPIVCNGALILRSDENLYAIKKTN
ncbi:MAG: PQQ-like beta-propeller repeat protein [Phycisphaerales bacterium]|nr:MAG: PQQ-like beta-propeller repeat protein [Phycisphaerales bacterium]